MTDVFKLPTMLTAKETAAYCKEHGLDKITEFRIRQLAISGEIVCVRAGVKYLINLEKFIEYLNSNTALTNKPEPVMDNKFGIKKVKHEGGLYGA